MSASQVQARFFAGSAQQWDAFVARDPAASSAHLFGWKDVIKSVYRHACPNLAAYQGDTIVGLLPLVDVRSLPFGRFLVSMPYLNAGGPIGSDEAVSVLTAAAVALARGRRAKLLELRCTEPVNIDLQCSDEKVASVLQLTAPPKHLWDALPAKLRSQVRRPIKEGVEVKFGADQVNPFFTVFARNMRDLGSPTHPKQFFQHVAQRFPDSAWFGCAYLGGQPIAAGCALAWRDEVEMLWASSLRKHNVIAPNMLLYWQFIERAAAQGFARFNFGRSTPGSGPHRFKQQWGALDRPLHWYREFMRSDASTPRKEIGTLSLATRIWRHVPLPIATAVGSKLRGGIPA